MNDELLLQKLAKVIYNKKGHSIIALDVRHLSSITDFLLIADGTALKHVLALKKIVLETLAAEGRTIFGVEGESGDWVVIDAGVIMIHLFIPELREKYRLESLFEKADIVEVVYE